MTPARRRNILRLRNGGKRRSLIKTLVVALLALGLFVYLVFNTRLWRKDAKVGIVINAGTGDIVVLAADAKEEDITTLLIPGGTELDVSRQLGRWKAKSIWKLGENEKLGGGLLRETIVKNFHFPVLGWADSGALGFAEGDILGVLKAILLPYKSNLTLADKIRIGVFSLGVEANQRNQINLAEGRFLKKVRLKDGEEGYVVAGKIPNDLLLVFSQTQFAQKGLKVNIKDASGDFSVSGEVGETIEVLGAKVAAISRLPKAQTDCLVAGREQDFAKILADIFGCKIIKETPGGNFDVEIEIGEGFAKRF